MSPLIPVAGLGVADGLEPVTLLHRNSGATSEVASALRRVMVRSEAAPGHGVVTQSDCRWHLPSAQLTEPVELGDTLLPATGEPMVVLQASISRMTGTTVCSTRQLALAGPSRSFRLQRAVYSKSPSGEAVPHWSDMATRLSGHLQPVTMQVRPQHDQQQWQTTHWVYLQQPVEIQPNCRLVDQHGGIYQLHSVKKPQQIGVYQGIEVFQQQ